MNEAQLKAAKARLRKVVERYRLKEVLDTPCTECGRVLGYAGPLDRTIIFDAIPERDNSYCQACAERAEEAGMEVLVFPMPTTEDLEKRLTEYDDQTPDEAA